MSTDCLNCAATVVPHNYCPNCGQKTTTHRYSIQHFIAHDFVHGIWHVDKGILFTLAGLFKRPGHSVREFIQGKRVPHFNFITLILLILTVGSIIAPYAHGKMSDLMPEQGKQLTNDFESIVSTYPKLVLIVAIPLYSLFSFALFKRAQLNYSEHLVINSNRIIPELIVGLLLSVISIFYTNMKGLILLYLFVPGLFSLLYSIWFYYQFFSWYGYSKKALLFRGIMVPVSYMFLTVLLGFISAVLSAKA